ncbi:MAG: LamG-like jellyroll fold domain-containing protein [Verrucomicrobiales bacterium]
MTRDLAPSAACFMHIAGLATAACLIQSATAQILYSESFDSQESAKVLELIDPYCFVDYVDYSSFTLGSSGDQEIEEAPNMIEGSVPTRGVMLRCNVESDENFGTGGIVNLILTDERDGSQVQFTGNFKMSFDVWMNLDEFSTRLSAGTTEQVLWGVGSEGAVAQGRISRADAAVTGTWGWLANEGGYGTEDSVIRNGTIEIERKNDGPTTDVGSDPLFQEAFPDAFPIVSAPANSWVQAEIEVRNGTVTVRYNGVQFHRTESAATDGGAFLGYEDPFNSLSWSPDFQFAIIDNVVVEQIGSGTIIVTSAAAVGTVRDEEGNIAEWSIKNDNSEPLEISAGTLSGDDVAAFTVLTEFPITIAPGETASLQVEFKPEAPNGEKSAILTLSSNDPTEPELPLELVGTRAVAEPLMAHFKLDETAGGNAVDASGVGSLGNYNTNPDYPMGFGHPSLIGDAGTSVGFTAANVPGEGNFAQLQPLHTPTISVSMWIKPEEIFGEHTLFNRDPLFSGTDQIYGAIIGGDGSLIFNAGGTLVIQTDPDLIQAGEIYHIVVTHLDEDGFGNDTAKRSRVYINGELIGEAIDAETVGFNDYDANARVLTMFLASKTAAGFGYTGDIDDVQIYSIELSEEQVAAMFATPGATAFDAPPPSQEEFAITSVKAVDVANVAVTWNSQPGKTYLLESSADLQEWGEVSDGVASGGESTSFVDTDAPAGTTVRYYRVTEE